MIFSQTEECLTNVQFFAEGGYMSFTSHQDPWSSQSKDKKEGLQWR